MGRALVSLSDSDDEELFHTEAVEASDDEPDASSHPPELPVLNALVVRSSTTEKEAEEADEGPSAPPGPLLGEERGEEACKPAPPPVYPSCEEGGRSKRSTAGRAREKFIPDAEEGGAPKRARAAAGRGGGSSSLPSQQDKWIRCSRCGKLRIVRPESVESIETWHCELNPDVRHNSCLKPQRLHIEQAPDDGERVSPKKNICLASLRTLIEKSCEDDLLKCMRKLPRTMVDAGWLVLPNNGSFKSHRLSYIFAGDAIAQKKLAERAERKARWPPIEQAKKGRTPTSKASGKKKVPSVISLQELLEQEIIPLFWDKQVASHSLRGSSGCF